MPGKINYIQELKRRKVFKSAGFYAFSAFIIMQVATFIVPALRLPDWTNALILVLLLLGFPIAMIFAWIYDRTPEGIVKTDEMDGELTSITENGLPRDSKGNSAIVFLDIDGLTKLMNQDEKKAIDLVHYKHKVILPFIEKYGGLLFKQAGDGTLCIFSDSAKAVCFSLDILQMWKSISPVKLKVGIHLDNLVFEHGEILGKGINFTKKIKDFAELGGICISQAVSNIIQGRPDIHTSSIGEKTFEGFTEPEELFSVNIPEQFVAMDGTLNVPTGQLNIDNKTNYSSMMGWIGGTLLLIFILFQSVQYFTKPKDINGSNSIAVFPFDNILKNDEFDWLTDGFARTLTFKLSNVEVLQVIDQLQVLKAIEKVQPQTAGIGYELLARKTAENMNINLLLLGNYQIYGDKIQITTKLVDVESGIVKPLIMETYLLDDPLSMQSDISDKISAILKSKNNSIN